MVDYTRRSIVLGTAGVAAAGAGVTAAAGGLQGSVEGQADVQAEQALTVRNVNVQGESDASFTRTSDDNTNFQAAVELNNGDGVAFIATIENSATDNLDMQVTVDAPDSINIDVRNGGNDAFTSYSGGDIDPDDNGDASQSGEEGAVQTGEETFIAKIGGGNPDNVEDIGIFAELDDTADAGSYDIGAAINPLSTDN